jgi:two-component system, NtrC family, sensor histidine kinase PilS
LGEISRRQLHWFLFCRVLVITLFLGGTIVYQLRAGVVQQPIVLLYLYVLIAVSYLQTIISSLALPTVRNRRLFSQSVIVWDLLFSVSVIYITGGVESRFSFLFLLNIISSAIFLSRKEVLFVASAATILYGSLLDLQFYEYLPLLAGLTQPEQISGRDYFFAVFINVIAFFLTALLAGLLAERQKRSESALERKAIDYEELENLNRTILASITSGLLIINAAGRIRSFNTAAVRITGQSLDSVYDQDIRKVLPGFQVYDETGFKVVRRGENQFFNPEGNRLVLGYASSELRGPYDQIIGLLVTFQDLTHLKEMEEQLKRADRLAAVGRLASGMAHEIRNPLASISGSVQLLMEDAQVTPEDRRLMGIVVREAERLSGLLSEFLDFAKPAPVRPSRINMSALLDELADLLGADKRFQHVQVCRDYSANIRLDVDREQFRQVLWNLVLNGAEAIDGEGTLLLAIDEAVPALIVEDSGSGIPESVRDKIFEPFFTTKDHGTGLGLATVHTILEAHGWAIELSTGRLGGARFTLSPKL